MDVKTLTEKRAQLVADAERYATEATPQAVKAFDAVEEEIRAIDASLSQMAVRGRLEGLKLAGEQVIRPEKRGGGQDAELSKFFATRGKSGSGNLELRTTLTAGTAATAGNTVPQSVMTGEFVKWLDWADPVRQLATVQTVPAALRLPVIDSRTTVAATGETVAYTESNFTTILKTFAAYKATATTPVTEELLFDSDIDVAAEVVADHARAHGKFRAQRHITGAGAAGSPAQEQGIMYSDSDWQHVVKTGATANTVDFDDVIDLFNLVPTGYSQNGSWIMNQATWAFLLKQKAATTGNYMYDGMQGMMLQNGATGMLMGRPVYISEFADVHNAASARLQIWFGDLARAYRIVDRKEVQFIVDPYTSSGSGITHYRSSMRSDAQIVDKRAGGVIVNKA